MGRYEGSCGGGFRYGPQAGMTKGDTKARYTNHVEDDGPDEAIRAALKTAVANKSGKSRLK